jgi:hypothetical protein
MEHWISGLTSLKTIPNAAADDLVRITKATLAQDAKDKTSAINAIVGQVREGKQIDNDLIERYVKEGGTPASLPKAIIAAMKGQALTYEERQLQGSMTAAKLHKLDQMRLLIDEQAAHQDSGTNYEKMSDAEAKRFGASSENPVEKDFIQNSKSVDLSQNYTSQKQSAPDTNLSKAYSQFIPPGTDIRQNPRPLNARGAVFEEKPTTAFLSGSASSETAAHETTHIGQHSNPNLKDSPSNYRSLTNEERWSGGENPQKTKDQAVVNGILRTARTGLIKNEDFPKNASDSMRELGAAFRGKEAQLKEGMTIWDLPEIKKMNFDSEDKKIIESWMLPASDRFSEGDSFEGPTKSKSSYYIEQMRRKIRGMTAP